MLDYLTSRAANPGSGIITLGRNRVSPSGAPFNLNVDFDRLPEDVKAQQIQGMKKYGDVTKKFYQDLSLKSPTAESARFISELSQVDMDSMSEAQKNNLIKGRSVSNVPLKNGKTMSFNAQESRAVWTMINSTHEAWLDKQLIGMGVSQADLQVVKKGVADMAAGRSIQSDEFLRRATPEVRALLRKDANSLKLYLNSADLFKASGGGAELMKDLQQILAVVEADQHTGGSIAKGYSEERILREAEKFNGGNRSIPRGLRAGVGFGLGFGAGFAASQFFHSQIAEQERGDYSCQVANRVASSPDEKALCVILANIKTGSIGVKEKTNDLCKYVRQSGIMTTSSPSAPAQSGGASPR